MIMVMSIRLNWRNGNMGGLLPNQQDRLIYFQLLNLKTFVEEEFKELIDADLIAMLNAYNSLRKYLQTT